MIKVIFFDVFGTLVDWRTSIVELGQSMIKKEIHLIDWEKLVIEWRMNYQPALLKINNNIGRSNSWKNLDEIHKETLEIVLKKMKINVLNEEEKNRLVKGWYKLKPWEDSRQGIYSLKNKYITATLSNGHLELQKCLIKYANLNFDILFSAEHFKKYKPEKIVYIGAVNYLGCKENECVLVASHMDDLKAASKFGLKTIFLSRKYEYGNYRKKIKIEEFRPDGQIDSLNRINEALLKIT